MTGFIRLLLIFVLVGAISAAAWYAGTLLEPPGTDISEPGPNTNGQEETAARRARLLLAMAENGPQEPNYALTFNALDPGYTPSIQASSLFDPSDDYWGLPRDPGYEEVAAYCGACHSLRIVMQQRATPERWRELLTWMVEKQGMAPLDAQDGERVHAYLSRHFSNR